jgi:hypothetical protein
LRVLCLIDGFALHVICIRSTSGICVGSDNI